MDRILQQKAELELERGKVASQLSAASSLLRLTCDAVIELDNNLCLTEDSPELAHMLMTLWQARVSLPPVHTHPQETLT
jgi:hypothetical protein